MGTTAEQVQAALWEAVRQEVVESLDGSYRFIHDRVQEAAYSLIPEASRQADHLRIGRLLATHTPPVQLEEAIFEIVSQLNRGAALIPAREEREQLAQLNLIAGRRPKASTAYASALRSIAGTQLLAEDAWERRHDLIFALELGRAECEFLTGELTEAEQRLAALSTARPIRWNAPRSGVSRMDLHTTRDQGSRAIAVGLDCLRHLGIDWSPHPTEEEAQREYDRIWSQLGSRTIEALFELPLMSDPVSLATLEVLTKLAPPAYYTDANLLALVTCRAVNLSLERGHCDASCIAYVRLGMTAGGFFGDYQTLCRFSQLGYDLVERRGLTRFRARVYMDFGNLVMPWMSHVRAGRDLVRRAFEAANEAGDLVYAAYCGNQLNSNILMAGDPLVEAEHEAERGLAFAQRARFGIVIDRIVTQLGLIRTLRGLTPTFGCLNDARFDEARIERRLAANPDLARAGFSYWTRKLQARFFAGDVRGGHPGLVEKHAFCCGPRIGTSKGRNIMFTPRCRKPPSAIPRRRPSASSTWTRSPRDHRQLQIWAANCAENFENRAALQSAPRSHAWRAAIGRPWISTNRPSARPAPMGL